MNAFEARSLAAGVSVLALTLCAAPSVRADRAAVPLGELVAGSRHVVIGVVKETARGTEPGAVSMLVNVDEILAGAPLGAFTLQHTPRNPNAPAALDPGTRILAFLQASPAAGAVLVQPIAGEQGVVVLSEGNAGVVRELVMRAVARKGELQLADVRDLLTKGEVPAALLGSLLGDLSRRLTRDDARLVTELACDGASAALPAVQSWAIGRVAALRVSGARPCLEALARDVQNGDRATSAVEALGELGDAEAALALRSILESVKGEPRAPFPGDTTPPPTTGPAEDPEDESDPTPDPAEGGSRRPVLGPRVLPPGPTDEGKDGEVEPDGRSDETGAIDAVSVAAVLAVGKLGDAGAVPELARLAKIGADFTLHSTIVHSLGLIGGSSVLEPLEAIARTHPDALIRVQARETLARLVNAAGGVR
jgi:hypothetical protein